MKAGHISPAAGDALNPFYYIVMPVNTQFRLPQEQDTVLRWLTVIVPQAPSKIPYTIAEVSSRDPIQRFAREPLG